MVVFSLFYALFLCFSNIWEKGNFIIKKQEEEQKKKQKDEKMRKTEEENKRLKQRMDKLEGMLNEMLHYAPGGPGYEEAKSDFIERAN